LHVARQIAGTQPWARRVLGIGGDSRSVRLLLDVLKSPERDVGTVLALGLLGDLAAIAPLLDLLADETLAKTAAVALNTITGAALQQRVFVPDTFDLTFEHGRTRRACRVAWRTADMLGVAFVGEERCVEGGQSGEASPPLSPAGTAIGSADAAKASAASARAADNNAD